MVIGVRFQRLSGGHGEILLGAGSTQRLLVFDLIIGDGIQALALRASEAEAELQRLGADNARSVLDLGGFVYSHEFPRRYSPRK